LLSPVFLEHCFMIISSRPTLLTRITGAAFAVTLSACSSMSGFTDVEDLSPQRIANIVSSPDRSATDRINDGRRKPEQMLSFIGIHPGITALDLSAASGYTTELLARAIGPAGLVYGQSQPRVSSDAAPKPAAPEGNSNPGAERDLKPVAAVPGAPRRSSPEALAEREKNLQSGSVPAAHIIAVVQRFEDPVPVAAKTHGLDLVTLMFNYHDLGYMDVDRAQMNAAVFSALKRGGRYVIADHAGRAGTGISESGTLHRIEETFLIREVEAAGFKLVGKANFLRNPSDPRDQNTPNPPQPKDEFVLKFAKP
jgi:predicted methyltransferase